MQVGDSLALLATMLLIFVNINNITNRWTYEVNWTYISVLHIFWTSLRQKCPYSELFWSVFSCIRTEYGKILTRITPNTDNFHAVWHLSELLLMRLSSNNLGKSFVGFTKDDVKSSTLSETVYNVVPSA